MLHLHDILVVIVHDAKVGPKRLIIFKNGFDLLWISVNAIFTHDIP